MAEALEMLPNRDPQDQVPQVSKPRHTRTRQVVHCAAIVASIVSAVVLIVGIVLIVLSIKRKHTDTYDPCGLSSDTNGVSLRELLAKIKRKYFELHRHKVYLDPKRFSAVNYKAYNPKPSYLKTITDTSFALQKELSNLKTNLNKLPAREIKAVFQAQHYLKQTFGQPYGVNYYDGGWMMGPNQFCFNPICEIKFDICNYLQLFKPRNLEDVNKLREVLKEQADGIKQYILNLKSGVKAGMVRSIEDCQAGIDAIKQQFLNISLYQEKGVLQSEFVSPALKSDFTSKLSWQDQYTWRKEKKLTVKQSIRSYIVEFIGKPILLLIRFLEDSHIRHCVPSSVSSGLASLPLNYEYMDQVKTDVKTSKMLPTGEILNGSKSYEMIMSYFTTNSLTPNEVNILGHKRLEKLYPQVLEIARNITKSSNDSEAVERFRELLSSRKYQFSQEPFPENESNAEAYKRCSTIKKAKQFCPRRWKATENYWYEARMVMNLLTSKIVPMFYFSDEKITVPVCPVQMVPLFNPAIGVEGYRASDASCSQSAFYFTPFFLESFRPRYEVWSTAAHETIPGHHTQLQGSVEHFTDDCKDIVSWLDHQTSSTAFIEGWAVYAENPLISETDIYDNDLLQKYGMLKAQIWRVLRLIIDTGLHYKGLKRDESLALFDKYAWDNSDIMKKEVTRYQSVFGQATAYMIGRLHIMELRDYTREKLGERFSHKEFHFQVLRQGNAPLEYLTLHIHKYIDCVLHNSKEGCDVIKARPIKKTGNEDTAGMQDALQPSWTHFNQLRYF